MHDLVDSLADEQRINGVSHTRAVDAARAVLDAYRQSLTGPRNTSPSILTDHELLSLIEQRLKADDEGVLPLVINATGIIIHTGLGRAPMAQAAVKAIAEAAGHYVPVELDMPDGGRGKRSAIVRSLLCELTGGESATVVNNNAAALLIVLTTLAHDREVIVSRGELIEIGGSFRLPDIMAAGGAILRDVGTTNRTRLGDYEHAINESTAALMKVHPSNYRIEGFTQEVSIEDLAQLARAHELPIIHDIGSGALRDLATAGIAGIDSNEPTATDSINAGADIVLFSGDKLLGGPQAGIIVGRADLIDRIERNPLMRAMRVDKLTLAGLGATLQLHRDPESAAQTVPVFAMITTPIDELQRRASTLADQLRSAVSSIDIRVEPSEAFPGGGSLPTEAIASCAVSIDAAPMTEHELAARLRSGTPAVLPRLKDGRVWLDMRTIFADQDEMLLAALRSALERL